jgi:hypothetical protein
MKLDTIEKAARYASGLTGIPESVWHMEELPEVDGYIFGEPIRGGIRLIVGRDGSVLGGASALRTEQIIEAFLEGRRNDVNRFSNLKHRMNVRYADVDKTFENS